MGAIYPVPALWKQSVVTLPLDEEELWCTALHSKGISQR